MDHHEVPHDLLVHLRTLHRSQLDTLHRDLLELGLTRLADARNNRVYRWSTPSGAECLKLYRTDKRDRARCEWTALRHLADAP